MKGLVKKDWMSQQGEGCPMVAVKKERLGLVVAAVLVVGGLLLFLVSVPSGNAATATQTQNLAAQLNSQVSWGTAGACTQNMATNDFGALTPNATSTSLGAFDAKPYASASTDLDAHHVWVGCVTSNSGLTQVVAEGTHEMTSAADTLALSNVAIGVTNSPSGTACQISANAGSAGACTLPVDGTQRVLVQNAPRGTNEIDWQYQLNLPANQPAGSYAGGQVTFTASS
jgi:hypothetical protein